MNNLYDIFLEFYSECDYLNHMIFIGSFDNKQVSKIYSCKELFDLEDNLTTEEIYNKCCEELMLLVQEFNTLGSEVTISIKFKRFELEEFKWCQKNPHK